MTDIAKLFSERQSYWAGQGFRGREIFDRLAADPELPNFFAEPDAAAIAGLSVHAMKMRRTRGMQPSFMRLSSRCVRYPRPDYCTWLAEMFHARAA